MATFLDFTLASRFSSIFIFIFMWIVLYGLISISKIFGENKGLHSLLALVVAFFLFIYKPAFSAIMFMTPWFFMLAFVAFFLLLLAKIFNPDLDTATLLNNGGVKWTLITIAIIIFLFALGESLSPAIQQAQTAGQPVVVNGTVVGYQQTPQEVHHSNLVSVLFHPAILGLLLLALIATFTIVFLTQGKS